jgi:hypothetical protein
MPYPPDDRTSAPCSASGLPDRGTQASEPSPTLDATRVGLPSKFVCIKPKITKSGDSLRFGSEVATNWPPLLAIGGIRGLIRALPSFTIDNVSALSAEGLVTQWKSKTQELDESGRASLQAFVDRVKEADPHVSIFLATQEAASVNDSEAPQPTAPSVSQQSLGGSQTATDRRQNDEPDSLGPTRGDDSVFDERK